MRAAPRRLGRPRSTSDVPVYRVKCWTATASIPARITGPFLAGVSPVVPWNWCAGVVVTEAVCMHPLLSSWVPDVVHREEPQEFPPLHFGVRVIQFEEEPRIQSGSVDDKEEQLPPPAAITMVVVAILCPLLSIPIRATHMLVVLHYRFWEQQGAVTARGHPV